MGAGRRRWKREVSSASFFFFLSRFLVLLIEYVCSCSFDFFTDMIGHPTKSPGVSPLHNFNHCHVYLLAPANLTTSGVQMSECFN